MALCRSSCSLGTLLSVSAELVAHRRQNLVSEVGFTSGAEAFVECSSEDMRGDGLVNRGLDGPASLSRVRHAARKVREFRVLEQGSRGQIQQPRGNDAATAPHLGDIG